MATHPILVHVARDSAPKRVIPVRGEDLLILSGDESIAPTHVRRSRNGVVLPPVEVSQPTTASRNWQASIPVKLLLSSLGAVEWSIETATPNAAGTASAEQPEQPEPNYRQAPGPITWVPSGTVRLVGIGRAVIATLSMLPAVALGFISTFVLVLEPSRLSPGVRLTDASIGLCALLSLLGAIGLRHSFRWWKNAIFVLMALSIAAIGLFRIVASEGRTVHVYASAPMIREVFGTTRRERYFLTRELAALQAPLAREGVQIAVLGHLDPCEPAALPELHGREIAALVCANRWLNLDPRIARGLGMDPTRNPAESSCFDVTGPMCSPNLSPESLQPTTQSRSFELNRPEQAEGRFEHEAWHPTVSATLTFAPSLFRPRYEQLTSYTVRVWGSANVSSVRSEHPSMNITWQMSAGPPGVSHTQFTLYALSPTSTTDLTLELDSGERLPIQCPTRDAHTIYVLPVDPSILAAITLPNRVRVPVPPSAHHVAVCAGPPVARLDALTLWLRHDPNALGASPALWSAIEALRLPGIAPQIELRVDTGGSESSAVGAIGIADCHTVEGPVRRLVPLDWGGLAVSPEGDPITMTVIDTDRRSHMRSPGVLVDRSHPILCLNERMTLGLGSVHLAVLSGVESASGKLWRLVPGGEGRRARLFDLSLVIE